MSKTVNYPLPTVHFNGTDKKTLLWGNIKIQKALSDLNDAINDCEFHGRDYYVQFINVADTSFEDYVRFIISPLWRRPFLKIVSRVYI